MAKTEMWKVTFSSKSSAMNMNLTNGYNRTAMFVSCIIVLRPSKAPWAFKDPAHYDVAACYGVNDDQKNAYIITNHTGPDQKDPLWTL